MGRDRSEQPMPDLFSTDRVRDAPVASTKEGWATTAEADASSQRHILPKNLRHAVKQLSDKELDDLFEAAFDEAKRRGRLPWSIGADSTQSPHRPNDAPAKRSSAINKVSSRRQVLLPEASLTRGQLSAVRASFKAGVTPSRIARQFGISQSNVRKALASDEKKR